MLQLTKLNSKLTNINDNNIKDFAILSSSTKRPKRIGQKRMIDKEKVGTILIRGLRTLTRLKL